MSEQTRAGRNGFDPDHVKAAISACEELDREVEAEKARYMRFAKQKRDERGEVLADAKERYGLPLKAMRAALKQRALERKAEAVRGDLEADQQDDLDLIRHALGDLAETPLGEAVVGRANGHLEEMHG